MALKEVIPNGEAGEIAVLRAFEPKADPSPPSGMLRDRSAHSGRQTTAARSGRQGSVIPRPETWPRDLAPEAVRNQKRGPSSLRSFGTTGKGKIEVLPLRGCFAIALLRTTKKQVLGRTEGCHPEAGGMAEGSRA